jgi:hypothetical protein
LTDKEKKSLYAPKELVVKEVETPVDVVVEEVSPTGK